MADIDRELLELAAKAAGVRLWWDNEDIVPWIVIHDVVQRNWSPLTDDGDALRLAVKLRLCVSIERRQASAMPPDQMSDDYFEAIEQVKSRDPYAATRRAIVRAAAELGRAM